MNVLNVCDYFRAESIEVGGRKGREHSCRRNGSCQALESVAGSVRVTNSSAPEKMTDALDVELLSIDPVEARITYSLGDQYLSLTIDEDLNVVNATREDPSRSTC